AGRAGRAVFPARPLARSEHKIERQSYIRKQRERDDPRDRSRRMTVLVQRMRHRHVDSEPDHHDQTVQRNQFGYGELRRVSHINAPPFSMTIHSTFDFASARASSAVEKT